MNVCLTRNIALSENIQIIANIPEVLRCGTSFSYLPHTYKAYEFDIMGAHSD
jgi:hypothetical protein